MASNPNTFTSTSAKQDLFSAVSSRRPPVSKSTFGKGKGGGGGTAGGKSGGCDCGSGGGGG